MTAYADAVAVVRRARLARDAARDRLYQLELRRTELARALQRAAGGTGATDPATARTRRMLEAEAGAQTRRLEGIAARQNELTTLRRRIDELRVRVATAQERVQTLASEVEELGRQLFADRPPGAGAEHDALSMMDISPQRDPRLARLQEVQAARATAEAEAAGVRDELATLTASVPDADGEAAALGQQAERVRAELMAVQEELAALPEQPPSPLDQTSGRVNEDIATERARLSRLETDLSVAIEGLYVQRTPQQLITDWDDAIPILLLPVRVETRWRLDLPVPELWVRVYPDDIAVNTHEKVLTDAEVEHGQAYWSHRQAARTNEDRTAAWRALAKRFSANRAAWVARQTKPTNWGTAAGEPDASLAFPEQPATKTDSWTVAPHTRVLPDRFVLLGWRGAELVLSAIGEPIDDILVLGPAPLADRDDGGPSISRDQVDRTLTLGASFRWIRDFDEAVRDGMAFRLRLDPDTARGGLDQLVVIGFKHSADASDGQLLVEELIDNHHYSRPGFALVPQGTATNNTAGDDSGYTRAGRDGDESAVAEAGPDLFDPVPDRGQASDGQRMSDYLGISYQPLSHADGADLTDYADAVAMNRALYAGILGYYLDHMLNEVIDYDGLDDLRRHFTDYVAGRGPLAAIRVGPQPYGILPTSVFARWRRPSGAHVMVGFGHVDHTEAALHEVLTRFDAAWSAVVPRLAKVGNAGDGAAHLLEVLGLHPTSAEFYQRVGYSFDTLQNMEALVWGGHEFADVLRMALEASAARSFLEGLGYNPLRDDGSAKPYPLLLQLIWRHYHTQLDQKQLIDGQPLSEVDPIKPYDPAAGKTYLDWLLEHAANPDALEAQDFGTASRPSSLLYMLLHFAITMEAAGAAFRMLAGFGIQADELIRSRKFYNIGPQPSPSVWEVFRAPANRLMPGQPSASPVLSLLHSPELRVGAGQFVAEQRAAIEALRGLSTARLERALVEHVDTLSYRLDAWQTSLFTRRLHRQRRLSGEPADRRTGLYLGAYGYLRHLRPAPAARHRVADDTLPVELRQPVANLYEQAGNGGYVHAPSLNHATAAALLRSGYLTHATPEQPDSLAVNISSDRVRRAGYLLDGIRNGQSLEVLLGVQFERGLHDWTTRPGTPVILDQLKPVLRAAFPIRRTRVPQAAEAEGGAGAATVTEDHQVVNGLDLARAAAFPWGIEDLRALSSDQQSALVHEKDGIANTLDALRDVLTAEAGYQLALGNFDRAAAVVQSIGNGTAPPDVEVIRTPRGTGLSFTNRLAVQFSVAVTDNPWPSAMTHRAQLEPALNNWLGTLMPDPEHVVCRVRAAAATGGTELATGTVSLAELGLQPIDLVYLTRSQPQESSVAELEARIRYAFARAHTIPDDAIVRISFADAGGGESRPFAEVLPLADRLRRLLGSARPLHAHHFQPASKDSPDPPGNPGRVELTELRTRVADRVNGLRALFRDTGPGPTLARALADAQAPGAGQSTVETLRAALRAIADGGFAYAFPVSAVGTDTVQRDVLIAQAQSVLDRFDVLSAETDARLTEVGGASLSANRVAEVLADVVKGWMGADVVLIPHFTFIDSAAVADAHAARARLLDHAHAAGSPLPVDEWLHGVACVRPAVHGFEMVRTMAEAILPEPLTLAPLQLPFHATDTWLGVDFPETTEVLHDTVAMVQHLPQEFDPAGAQGGLLIDEWVETVPNRREVTGFTFNYNAPNSEPPQALLLAVTPEETGSWQWDDVVDTVLDTFRRARLRAVEPDHVGGMPGIGTLLPAVIAEFTTGRASVSLDYSLTLAPMREHAAAVSVDLIKLEAGG